MADLVITPGNVQMGTGAKVKHGILGATATAGQGIVRDPATQRYVLADSNHATPALRRTEGVALNGGANGQPVTLQEEGPITIGAAVVAGTIFVQSDTPGGIAPAADLGAGEEVTVLGVAISATQIALKINRSQAVVA
jgi:hypothetical protein